MNPDAKTVEVVITAKQQINHDCYLYSFEFVKDKIDFGIGQFFKFYVTLPTNDHPEG